MAVTAPARRPSVGARRTGYVIAALFNMAMLYVINIWPGWQAVPFLTDDTHRLLTLVNLSVVAGLAANLIYLSYDPPSVKALGDLVTTGIGLAVLVRIWQVFPFDFGGYRFDWPLLFRVLIVVALVGAAIGLLVQFGILVRASQRTDPGEMR
jgi:hypothetical protein